MKITSAHKLERFILSICGLLFLFGCHKDDIHVYRVPKDTGQPSTAAADNVEPAVPTSASDSQLPAGHPDISGASSSGLTWKVPANWDELPAQGMRVGSFVAKGSQGRVADVSIVPLSGIGGGVLMNVNRWRRQVGLPPISEAELSSQPVEIAGQKAQLFEEEGMSQNPNTKTNIVGAILARNGTAWFFKMIGNNTVVTEQKPVFLEFLKSIRFDSGSAQNALPPHARPNSDANAPQSAASDSNENKPKWKIPSGWQEVSGSQFVVAKFSISGENNSAAAVTVSDARGGLTLNVNRWRSQLGLEPLSDDQVEKQVQTLAVPSGKAMLIDMRGIDSRSNQKARLVAAIVQPSEHTWYYKLMGDEQLVEREKQPFIDFVKSAIYP